MQQRPYHVEGGLLFLLGASKEGPDPSLACPTHWRTERQCSCNSMQQKEDCYFWINSEKIR